MGNKIKCNPEPPAPQTLVATGAAVAGADARLATASSELTVALNEINAAQGHINLVRQRLNSVLTANGQTRNDYISRETVIDISLRDTENNESKIGGFVLMENIPFKLTFRVIALVSNEGDVNTKAKKLFEQFKNNDILKYLNENSLNQAGYEVELDNQSMFDSIDMLSDFDEFLYAFDKAAWTANGKYTENYPKKKKKWEKVQKADGSYEVGQDGYYKQVQVEYEDPTNVLSGDELDFETLEAYNIKLKNKGKSYNKGVMILSDYEANDNTGGFSRTAPLSHYAIFIYLSDTIDNKSTYAHEIGHMLGLEHTFYKEKEETSYKETVQHLKNRKNILDQKKNEKFNWIEVSGISALKSNIEKAINDSQIYFNKQVTNNRQTKDKEEKYYVNYKDSDVIKFSNGPQMTKKKYLNSFQEEINKFSKMVTQNKTVLEKLKSINIKYYDLDDIFYLTKEKYLSILKDNIEYLNLGLTQKNRNYLKLKQGVTDNIMDYDNVKKSFMLHQIMIMRDDFNNY